MSCVIKNAQLTYLKKKIEKEKDEKEGTEVQFFQVLKDEKLLLFMLAVIFVHYM